VTTGGTKTAGTLTVTTNSGGTKSGQQATATGATSKLMVSASTGSAQKAGAGGSLTSVKSSQPLPVSSSVVVPAVETSSRTTVQTVTNAANSGKAASPPTVIATSTAPKLSQLTTVQGQLLYEYNV
jgi:hypothetical protein